ncbi:MAG: hypothetical protein HYW85_04400, partial [Deltaproteobacteria bacterium]|nr:hypothetical protein [Deltaproteobacteria bacterium]
MFLRRFSFLWLFLYASLSFAAPASIHTYFSPNGGAQEAIIKNISHAKRSIDIAMYNFSSDKILNALESVKNKNKRLKIRMIFDDAANTKEDTPGSDKVDSKAEMSASLEKIGIDVRYVSKIMHHKFVIVDGFPDGLRGNEDFSDTVLLNGSGNFSSRADTSYDENLVEIKNDPQTTTEFQKEFQLMWNYSYDFPDDSLQRDRQDYVSSLEPSEFIRPIFTSQNFKKEPKFKLNGNRVASSNLEEAIGNAKTSIYVATGHFRLKPLADALIAAKKSNKDLDIKVVLDSQEFVSPSEHERVMRKYRRCVKNLGPNPTEEELEKCELAGEMKFSRYLAQNGIDVRIKYSSYIWYYAYDPQMHHKYMIVDGKSVWSGSYNWSRNAEFNTFENVVHYQGEELAGVAEEYTNNFWGIWELNRDAFSSHLS